MPGVKPTGFHVPEPHGRPGDKPDFSNLRLPEAGSVERPPCNVSAADIRGMAHTMIRVMNDEGDLVGPWAEEIRDEDFLDGLKKMMTVRMYDKRMKTAQRQGKISFYVQCLGEEAVSCAFQRALQPGDINFPTYRQQGLLITSGYPLHDMVNQAYSNAGDPLRGRQLPGLYSSREHGFFSVSGNLATQFVQAVGWAMASAIKKDSRIAAAWIGDGSTAESDFYSAMIFASTYRAPVILNVVNNQWAISTFQGIARGDAESFAARGHGFGIPSLRVDGNDYPAVLAASRWAVERARAGYGPALIEYVTYRAGPHSTSDDPSAYRPQGEFDEWPLGDPVERLKTHLIRRGIWSEIRHEQALSEIESGIVTLQKKAEESSVSDQEAGLMLRSIFEGVYKETPPHLRRQLREAEG